MLCHGMMRQMKMACSGRRNKLGSLHGPMNEENLNGSHPALLAALNCNSDTQLPYRLPICKETHCDDLCKMECVNNVSRKEIIEAAQIAQDAQAGYACDYSNKRGPRAFNEVKECVKGHRTLAEHTAQERPAYIGKRHATRLCNDAYGKGIVRSNQESTNLRVYSKANAVIAAETCRTSLTTAFPGVDFTAWREYLCDKATGTPIMCPIAVD